ncbi:MAG: hypothetical protein J0M05_04980 [Candidatus Kapabacteria bacterium]|jgi:flagellar hook-associated protein 3 FlgL|nr:hypothetical protein [Candidatus Kapabacteria bacterium]
MRITQNAQALSYNRSILELQERVDRGQNKITTGLNYSNLSEQPKTIVDIQQLQTLVDRNSRFITSLDEVSNEMYAGEFAAEKLAEKVQDIRQLAIDASKHTAYDKMPVLGQQVFQRLTDMVRDANTDFGGRFVFAGTKNTPQSLNMAPPSTNNLPFELVQEAATPDNPSGLRVIFKGNTKERMVDKSIGSPEQINITANDAFGGSGTEIFDTVIDIYNKMTYRSDGTLRTSDEVMNVEDQRILQGYVQTISNQAERLDEEIGRYAYRRSRLEAISVQLTEESTRLKELRSQLEDTNMPETILQLKRDQNAYEYSLNVGSRLFQTSLLDFLR